jgi:hypothetical protein
MPKFSKDLFERVLSTGVQAGLAVLLTWIEKGGNDVLHLDWKSGIVLAVNAAVLAVLKGVVAKNVGNKDSASLSKSV